MEEHKISYQFSYHIIPFAYAKQYELVKKELECRVNDNGKRVWESENIGGGQRIFEHVKKLIDHKGDFNATIGVRYVLSDAARLLMGLPGNAKDKLVLKLKKNNQIVEYQYSISKVHLYVFETQVGFLSFDIEYDLGQSTLEKVIDSNYYIKNVIQNKGSIFFRKRVSKEETKDIDISITSLISKPIENLNVTTFFENDADLPKQALVFSSICLDDKSPDKKLLETSLFEMRRLFRSSYKPSCCELAFDNNEEVLQLFENSYWGAALEGVANLFYLTDDEETNKFFTGGYTGLVENTYLYLYIIALHQRYALLNYSVIASDIRKVNGMEIKNQAIVAEIRKVKLEIAYFFLRSNFKNLSNITHQDKVYNLLRRVLKIEGLAEEINNELNGLCAILEDQAEKERIREERVRAENELLNDKRESRRFNFLTIAFSTIATFFCLPGIVISLWDIIGRMTRGEIPFINSDKFYITITSPLLYICTPVAIIIFLIMKLTKNENVTNRD